MGWPSGELASLLFDVLIIVLLVFTVNNYLENPTVPIRSDGAGYYDYLPSLFIYHDLNRKDATVTPKRIEAQPQYVVYDEHRINKYPAGTALLMSPFFFSAHAIAAAQGEELDGFSKPYQRFMFFAGLFYLFLGLYFLRKALLIFDVPGYLAAFVQLMVVFSTSIMHYISFEPTFSHLYSFFLVSLFIYLSLIYFESPSKKRFLLLCLVFGLVVFVRQVNVIVLGMLPFLAGSFERLSFGIRWPIKQFRLLLIGAFLAASFTLLQMVLWHLQTGHFIVYSYVGEGFNFLSPEIINILFSYRKGLFIYTPVTLIAIVGLLIWWKRSQRFLVYAWFAFFALLTYVLSSWWSWDYGCSFGNRAFIDFYGFLFLPLGVLLSGLGRIGRSLIMSMCLLTVPVIMIQTKQYKHFILDWYEMDEEKYWEIFLKQDPRFTGMYFKTSYAFDDDKMLKQSFELGSFTFKANASDLLLELPISELLSPQDSVDLIEVSFSMDFDEDQDARLELVIASPSEVAYYHNVALLGFKEEPLNTVHRGVYRFELPRALQPNSDTLRVTLFTREMTVEMQEMVLKFYQYPGT